jgi:hypothetical protein
MDIAAANLQAFQRTPMAADWAAIHLERRRPEMPLCAGASVNR